MMQHEPISLGSIKAKKNKVISSTQAISYETPVKATGRQGHKLLLTTIGSKNKSGQDLRETKTEQKADSSEPRNPFAKQIFIKQRQIKTVAELQDYYKSGNMVSRSNYIYKPRDNLDKSVSSVNSSGLVKRRKSLANKMPVNILAAENSVMEQSARSAMSVKSDRPRTNMASSIKKKIIKNSDL